MPTVRRGERQAEIIPLRGGTRQAVETFQSQGGEAARAKQDVGYAIAEAGERLARFGVDRYTRIQQEQRDAADETAILAASNRIAQWKRERIFDAKSGALAVKGEASFDLPTSVREDYQSLTSEIEKGLSTDRQRTAFEKLRAQELDAVDLVVQRHVLGEIQEHQARTLQATEDTSADAAIHHALDPKLVAGELRRGEDAIRTLGPRLGLPQEAIDARIAAHRSKVHVGVIGSLLASGKDEQARDYFAATSEQIAGDKLKGVQDALEEGTARKRSQEASDAILKAGGTKTEQREKAKAIEDPRERELALQLIEHEHAIQERDRIEADKQRSKDVLNLIDGNPRRGVEAIPPATWQDMSYEERRAAQLYAEDKVKAKVIPTDIPTKLELYELARTDPKKFADLKLLPYRGKLSDQDLEEFARLQLQVREDKPAAEKVIDSIVTPAQILSTTVGGTFDVKNPKHAELLRRLMVETENHQVAAGGKKLRDTEIQALADSLYNLAVLEDGWFSDTTKPVHDVTIADVPPHEQKRIADLLGKAGLKRTEDEILRRYLRDLQLKGRIRKP